MRLSWSNSADIAAALLEAHPETERLSLSHEKLLQLIRTLPGFIDKPVPPQPKYLDHILWTWMRLADGGATGNDGGAAGDQERCCP
jgi:FeS assembly protein IscX